MNIPGGIAMVQTHVVMGRSFRRSPAGFSLIYGGTPDRISRTGYVSPSHPTFDRREWAGRGYRIVLVNLWNTEGRKEGAKILYRVTIARNSDPSKVCWGLEGTGWPSLVRTAKRWVWIGN